MSEFNDWLFPPSFFHFHLICFSIISLKKTFINLVFQKRQINNCNFKNQLMPYQINARMKNTTTATFYKLRVYLLRNYIVIRQKKNSFKVNLYIMANYLL